MGWSDQGERRDRGVIAVCLTNSGAPGPPAGVHGKGGCRLGERVVQQKRRV